MCKIHKVLIRASREMPIINLIQISALGRGERIAYRDIALFSMAFVSG